MSHADSNPESGAWELVIYESSSSDRRRWNNCTLNFDTEKHAKMAAESIMLCNATSISVTLSNPDGGFVKEWKRG